MRFLNILNELKSEYSDNYVIRKNGTLLLKPGGIPNCRHMLYQPLSQEYIQSYLIAVYKQKFPQDYIDFLTYSNGADLFWVKLKTEGFCFAHTLFTIFGLPLTPPFARPRDMEEPFDLRIEDLARHEEIPDTWLKCGTYTKNYNFDIQNDIFIDTKTQQVYTCERNMKEILDSWENLDKCFCDIFESFLDSKYEYED